MGKNTARIIFTKKIMKLLLSFPEITQEQSSNQQKSIDPQAVLQIEIKQYTSPSTKK